MISCVSMPRCDWFNVTSLRIPSCDFCLPQPPTRPAQQNPFTASSTIDQSTFLESNDRKARVETTFITTLDEIWASRKATKNQREAQCTRSKRKTPVLSDLRFSGVGSPRMNLASMGRKIIRGLLSNGSMGGYRVAGPKRFIPHPNTTKVSGCDYLAK